MEVLVQESSPTWLSLELQLLRSRSVLDISVRMLVFIGVSILDFSALVLVLIYQTLVYFENGSKSQPSGVLLTCNEHVSR